MSYSSNGRPKLSEKGLLTPDNCVVTLIDHQPQMLFGESNFGLIDIVRTDRSERLESIGEWCWNVRPLSHMFSRPGIKCPENWTQLCSKPGQRVFNADGHLCEHLPLDKSVPLKFPQLLGQDFLRDLRHFLAQSSKSKRRSTIRQPPEDYRLPAAANEAQQVLNRTLAHDAFGAHAVGGFPSI